MLVFIIVIFLIILYIFCKCRRRRKSLIPIRPVNDVASFFPPSMEREIPFRRWRLLKRRESNHLKKDIELKDLPPKHELFQNEERGYISI